MHRRTPFALTWLVLAVSLTGCASMRAMPKRPALISHIVLVTLNDPTLADQVIADCDQHLATIPGIVMYAAGKHLDIGRDNVDSSYDVGFYFGFDSTDAYENYLEHPQHLALLARWKSAVKAMKMYDFEDTTK